MGAGHSSWEAAVWADGGLAVFEPVGEAGAGTDYAVLYTKQEFRQVPTQLV